MTSSADHIDDELLSAFVDEQVTLDEREQVQTHLRTCSDCQQRLLELRAIVDLLRDLPEVPMTRDFKLGPRAVADPPNVVRLRRWYAATRVAAGSLAAGFVLLTAGVLFVDSRQSPAATSAVSKPQVALAPAAAARTDGAPAPTVAPAPKAAAPAAAAPASGALASPAAAAGASAVQRSAPAGQPEDQVAATTSTSPLPTPVPTPAPTAVPLPPPSPTSASTTQATPLRLAAIGLGILAVLALVTAIAVRQRLQHAVSHL